MSGPQDDGTESLLASARARRKSLRTAMAELEAAITTPAPGRLEEWRAGLATAVAELQRVFQDHVEETEAHGGVLDEVVETTPRLANAVTRLRNDHHEITASLEELAGRPAPAGPDDHAWVDVARDQALRVLGQVVRHRHRGADLLHEAFSVDISEAD